MWYIFSLSIVSVLKGFMASNAFLMVAGRKLNNLGLILFSIFIDSFFRSSLLSVKNCNSVGSRYFCLP